MYKEWMSLYLRDLFKSLGMENYENYTHAHVNMLFGFVKPKSAKDREFHNVKPDTSNLVKSFEDCLGKVLGDDARNDFIQGKKVYIENLYQEGTSCLLKLYK